MMSRMDKHQGTSFAADRGFDDAEDLSAKAILAVKLNDLIDQRLDAMSALAAG